MTANEDIRDIFSILHDGTISAWTGDKNVLMLTVECQYLAGRINKSFDRFFLELSEIDKLTLDPWTNSVDIPSNMKIDFADIFKAELEIMSADVKDDFVLVTCLQFDTSYDYNGGNLSIRCKKIKVFDQNKKELTIEQLGGLSRNYWSELSKK